MRFHSTQLPSRRALLHAGASIAGASPFLGPAWAASPTSATVRDRLWLWSHVAGSYNGMFGLPGTSRMTPVEAAFYMSIPNVYMLHRQGTPEPPLSQYALAFESLREVVWGIVGEGGATERAEREMVLELALANPKITGVVLDDFFTGRKDGKTAALPVEELRRLKARLTTPAKRLDLWVVLYEHQLEAPITEHLKLCDGIQFWTWSGDNLDRLDANFAKAEQLVPGARMALGLYWWDFGGKKPLSRAAVEHQCELGLQWLRTGRIEAMVFCGSWLCDRGLEAVDWTRQWIRRVGSGKVPALKRS